MSLAGDEIPLRGSHMRVRSEEESAASSREDGGRGPKFGVFILGGLICQNGLL